ncbi:MAG: AI-2E family transporter [Lachnospiraceae bacterium]|nr:AI-2E family transporter [Lachnospiraceae bacterium]
MGEMKNTGKYSSESFQQKEMKKLKKMESRKYTQISFYVIVTVVLIYLILKFLSNIGTIGSAITVALSWLNVLLKPLIIGFAFAYLLYPLDDFLQKQLNRIPLLKKSGKSHRGLAVAITAILLITGLGAMLSVLTSAITRDLTLFHVSDTSSIITSMKDSLDSFYANAKNLLNEMNMSEESLTQYIKPIQDALLSFSKNMVLRLSSVLTNLPGIMSTLLFSIIFTIYFQLDGEGLKHYWGHVLKSVLPKKAIGHVRTFVHDADTVFAGYIRGQFLDALVCGTIISITLTIIDVRYALLIGILTGLGNLIPYVGPFMAYTSTTFVCLMNWDPKKWLLAMILIFIITTIDGNVLNPKFLSHTISIHPLLVIASLIIGGKIGGLLGMLLAVPCGALAKIYFEKGIHYIRDKRDMDEESTASSESSSSRPE